MAVLLHANKVAAIMTLVGAEYFRRGINRELVAVRFTSPIILQNHLLKCLVSYASLRLGLVGHPKGLRIGPPAKISSLQLLAVIDDLDSRKVIKTTVVIMRKTLEINPIVIKDIIRRNSCHCCLSSPPSIQSLASKISEMHPIKCLSS